MGKNRPGWRRGNKRGGSSKDRDRDGVKKPKTERGYRMTVKDNELFATFYKGLGIVPEGEWETFYETMKKSLPTTFRITGSRETAQEVLDQLQRYYFHDLKDFELDGEKVKAPKPLPWYPNTMAWEMETGRNVLRKSPKLQRLHKYIVYQVEHGNLSRQEAVSMIPPLLLDVQPGHKVLDMCAAPGSKTAQLIEMMHADGKAIPDGLVVANDSDSKRCYLLVHQSKRLQSPCFVITNHDATLYPKFVSDGGKDQIMFDRVLCDVPCSGDGTLRKNTPLWGRWTPMMAMGLHDLQVRILVRGLQLLKVGGRLVYSTCSLNPVENEAVVAEVLRRYKDEIGLVDVSDKLPGLRRDAGMTSWRLMNRDRQFFTCKDEVPANQKRKYKPSMFAPTEQEVEEMHLERCLRLLPHHQNTGGFFVAVLEKKAPLSRREAKAQAADDASASAPAGEGSSAKPDASPNDESSPKPEDGSDVADVADASTAPDESDKANTTPGAESEQNQKPAKKSKGRVFKEEPFVFMVDEGATEHLDDVKGYYGFDDSFPDDLLLTRSHGGKKHHVYLVSPLVREIIRNNDDVKIVNTGVKVFSRSESKDVSCGFRLCQDGVDAIFDFLHKRKYEMSASDLYKILQVDTPTFAAFDAPGRAIIPEQEQGSAVFYVTKGAKAVWADKEVNARDKLMADMKMVVWIGRNTVRCLINKQERLHYKLLLGALPEEAHADEGDKPAASADAEDQAKSDEPEGEAEGEAEGEEGEAEAEAEKDDDVEMSPAEAAKAEPEASADSAAAETQ